MIQLPFLSPECEPGAVFLFSPWLPESNLQGESGKFMVIYCMCIYIYIHIYIYIVIKRCMVYIYYIVLFMHIDQSIYSSLQSLRILPNAPGALGDYSISFWGNT